jgi:hypothetical protein
MEPKGSLPHSQDPPLLVPILSQNNLVHTTTYYLSKIHLNIILRSLIRLSSLFQIELMSLWISGHIDDSSHFLLKKCVPYMLKTLLELVTASIREGIFPSTFQTQ